MFDLSDLNLEKKFGGSPILIASTMLEDGETFKGYRLASLLGEAIHVISCDYEDKTQWGKEVTTYLKQLYLLYFKFKPIKPKRMENVKESLTIPHIITMCHYC